MRARVLELLLLALLPHALALRVRSSVRAPLPLALPLAAHANAFSHAAEHASSEPSFQKLRQLEERCSALLRSSPAFLLRFYSPALRSFKLYPDATTARVSITSTCMVLNAILSNADFWKEDARWDPASSEVSVSSIVRTLHTADWTYDSFQLPVIVSTLARFNSVNVSCPKYVAGVEKLLEQRSRISLHRGQYNSAYLRLLNARALLAVVENKLVPPELLGTHRLGYALERATLVAYDEMCRQLAYSTSGDLSNFDPVVLAFTTIAYYETSQSLFLRSFARGVIPSTEIKLVRAALQVLFSCQREDGTWPKGEPISKKGSVRGETDIGNNYVFFLDMVDALLGPGSMAERDPGLLAPYLPQLERCLAWAEANVLEEMLPEDCDPVTERCYGSLVRGWRSNHISAGGAVSWCSAQVFSAVGGLRRLVRALTTDSILAEFKGRKGGAASAADWKALMDADLLLAGSPTSFKGEIEPRVLGPQIRKDRAVTAGLLPPEPGALTATLSEQSPSYSLILFGPPGTAKTTTCTSMAAYLGWSFLTIDTACFLADGLENVASRMTYVFDRLNALERTIILFDEVEEFCLDRENANLGMESRMLTTAMLTQLNDLRRKQQSIFIVATNRLRSFDAAVTRPGRFDMLFFLGTPNLSSRIQRLRSKIGASRLPPEQRESAVQLIGEFMDSRWENVRFLSFAENEVLMNGAIDLSTTGSLTKEALIAKLQSIQRTATIQGAVKEDYLISETMSRV